MKIVGLITEYNPFHNGHKFHIEKALEISGCDVALVVMSGDFVQRGAPAILPKHLRAEMALKAGAAVVFELPICYATGSAEYFATGAVSLLHAFGCVDSICFGSECGDIAQLRKIASVISNEPVEYKKILQTYLKNGISFPLARQNAFADYTGDNTLAHILAKPNNTLAVEYIKALIRLKSPIKPYTIQRLESDYHDKILCETYSSASAIRTVFSQDNPCLESLGSQVPDFALSLLKENYQKRYPIDVDDFSLLLKYKLLLETKNSLTRYADVTPELANRIINERNHFLSWADFCNTLKTKEITFSRISRVLLHILLGITKDQMQTNYARILGFSKKHSEILRVLKDNSALPLITKLREDSLPPTDIFASDLYESVVTEKYGTPFINEYQKKVIII